jgi:hypothetical protein
MKKTWVGKLALCILISICFEGSTPAAVLYVDVNSPASVSPYATWATAATNIQEAITASVAGDAVLVTNGLYAVGGKSMDGVITNRIAVDKAILVQSVNGPAVTIIQGAWDSTSTNGPGALRCAWLTNGAVLNGFALQGGGTRKFDSLVSGSGGGVWGASTSATVSNCVIATNYSYAQGGGAYRVTLSHCTLTGNHAVGSGIASMGGANIGAGGGAANCNLMNCMFTANWAVEGAGGGAFNCNATNCALINNISGMDGSGAASGKLVNCTVANNYSQIYYGGAGGAVGNATLLNCIVYGNFKSSAGLGWVGPANYFSNEPCNFTNSDTDPLPSGPGNMDMSPQFLADGIHLAAASPCIGAGLASVVSGTDLDGQPWNNPPSIGCDEWQSAPITCAPPTFQIGTPAHGLTFDMVVAGQAPFSYFWNKDGVPIQDDGHHSNSGTVHLVVNNFGPNDAGLYQVVVSNAFGVVTSQMAQVVIHLVDAASANPIAPYSTWETAATSIQDTVNIAAAGDIVLVTNGVYAVGGKVMAGDLTNRVALDKPLTVISVNGCSATVIQGAWDPASTNGPGAVRCAYLSDGAVLNGFTLQNGATRASGALALTGGGGVWCNSTNGIVSDCVLSHNRAIDGGGTIYGTLNNCLVMNNMATIAGGTYYSILNNCTVVNNYTTMMTGGGTYGGIVRNSIVVSNFVQSASALILNNYDSATADYAYSCTFPAVNLRQTSNIIVDPQLLDSFHIASTSPCRGAGSAVYSSGTDLDGEPWGNPPSMGCDEVIVSNLVGALSVNVLANQTNMLINRFVGFSGIITGRASRVEWLFGDGPTVTNSGVSISHSWTNSGDYTVTFTAYNNDNLTGVSTNTVIHVQPLSVPQLQSAMRLTNGLQFQFVSQTNANYTVQYATNLTSPVTWLTLKTMGYSSGGVLQITDTTATNDTRFYRVLVQ